MFKGKVARLQVRRAVAHVVLAAALTASGSTSAGVVLYDGQLGTGMTSQNWLYFTNPTTGALATQNVGGGLTTLDTTPQRSESAGFPSFGHPGVGVLDRDIGYTVSFVVKILQETHVSTNRAGFSVIVLGDDLKGIEIGFWTDRVWAQNDSPLFTHGETAMFDTTSALVGYDLTVLGSTYSLFANDQPILSGALRDYSGFGFPYFFPNFLFLGDNTSSASASVQIARIERSSVPECSGIALMSVAASALAAASRRSRRNGEFFLH